jgi:ornithine cyclodeaminase
MSPAAEPAAPSPVAATKGEVLVLREPQIRDLLDPAACIQAMQRAFAAYATGQAQLPPVINLDIPESSGEVHIKTGHLSGSSYYAVKIASGFYGHSMPGVPNSNGMVLVFDSRTGAPAAFLLDNGFMTDLRTAAAGALAVKYCAREWIDAVAVIGSGAQARYQLNMLPLVRGFRQARIWGRDRQKAAKCAQELAASAGQAKFAVAESVQAAVQGADLVITVTASREPLLRAEWLKPGATVIAVGSDGPDKQELDFAVLARADRIVADSLPQCLRLGEIHHAVDLGAITKERVSAELGEIAAGLKPGRENDQQLIVCDLTGVGVQDVAAASLVMERALAAQVGDKISIE